MAEQQIRFVDGAAYERMMGTWSRLVADGFLDWLALPPGLRCVDVGCGNGAFTEYLIARCNPAEVQGIDPSEDQLAFARTRPGARLAQFQQGDAMKLPFADSGFDTAMMALVLFFVPEPKKGVAEMVRVVKSGGTTAAYVWDVTVGGYPWEPLAIEFKAIDRPLPAEPSAASSRIEALQALWTEAGLRSVEQRKIAVERRFHDFEDFWDTTITVGPVTAVIDTLAPAQRARLKDAVRARMTPNADGSITYGAYANAIKGRVAK